MADTELLYATDAYLRSFDAIVQDVTAEGWLVLDRTAFYPTGGGQPHDQGTMTWDGGSAQVVEVRKQGPLVVHRVEGDQPVPGTRVHGEIDWQRRFALMRELGEAQEMKFENILAHIGPCDLVLVEGFKRETFPKIEIRRDGAASREPLHGRYLEIVAIASDRPETEGSSLPTFYLDDTKSIADFVVVSLGLQRP